MKRISRAYLILGFVLWSGATRVYPALTHDPVETKVTVYVHDELGVQFPIVAQAKRLAGEMFAKIGVYVEWRSGQPSPSSYERPIIVELVASAPGNVGPGALAFARPYEGTHITIFYARVEGAAVYPHFIHRVLAHVLVHEITHLVQGVGRHSDIGVMKAHWTEGDFSVMQRSPLPFTPEDVRLIYHGLATRSSAAAAKADTYSRPSRGRC